MINEISIVIGSWGSYNACNKRALGSKWLNLSVKYCYLMTKLKFIIIM